MKNWSNMGTNRIKIAESRLRRIIREAVIDVVTSKAENEQNIPRSNDVFDLDTIPMDILDNGYVRYEPYNLDITYRHPLRRISEGIDYKKHIEQAKQVILDTYPIKDEQFIIRPGHNGMYAAILASLVDNNVQVIEEAMKKLGYFRSKPTDKKLLSDRKGRTWIDLRFEPIVSNDMTEFVRSNYMYVYHLAPSIHEKSIMEHGLVPSNNNSEFKYYEPRVYLMKGNVTSESMQELVNELYQQAKQNVYENLSPIYSLFTISLDKIDDNVRFYGDINERDGLFITSKISPSAFIRVDKLVAEE